MKNTKAEALVRRRLQEAVSGTITAEKVPSGGAASPLGGGGEGGEGGEHHEGGAPGEGEMANKVVEIEASEEALEALVQGLCALKSAGAPIHCCRVDGEEIDLEAGGEPEGPEGSAEHEQAESPEHEAREHEAGEAGEKCEHCGKEPCECE